VLVDLSDRRILAMFFIADGRMVFLFVEKARTDLNMTDTKVDLFFGSVEFPVK
jgi:hypothetical protein